MTWIVSVLAVVLLYVGTWPLVEYSASEGTLPLAFNSGPKRKFDRECQPWVRVVYGPIHALEETDWGYHPLDLYYRWWWHRMTQPKHTNRL